MRSVVRIAALLFMCSHSWLVSASSADTASMSETSKARLLEGLSCSRDVWDTLSRLKSQTESDGDLYVDTTMCGFALDAFCTSTPRHEACRGRKPTGAYAGYYLMRYAMPVVAMLREGLRTSSPSPSDRDLTEAGLGSMHELLRLLSPNLRGCDNLSYVRTWCSKRGRAYQGVPAHRAAVAYLAAESTRLFAECWIRDSRCPVKPGQLGPLLARWYDVLLWDHALLEGTYVRNSLTQRFLSGSPSVRRLVNLRDTYDASDGKMSAFSFAVDGWWIAVAANLLAIDRLLDGPRDPRPNALTVEQRLELERLVSVGMEVLAQRQERTQLKNFQGVETEGIQFDSRQWDLHEYRRFSGVSEGGRPFSVIVDPAGGKPRIKFEGSVEQRAQNVGLDSGHYRRITWLFYTLSDVQDLLDSEWVSEQTLKGLANQFAYAVFWHPCHHRRNNSCGASGPPRALETIPRFVNYVSGQNGWYRLTPRQACDAGVPPFGFSTMMTISENRWWSRFNEDITRIWVQIDSAANDPALPAPSRGDSVPCGPRMGTEEWNENFHQTVFESDGRLTSHGLGLYAMKYWAELHAHRP